MKKLFLFVVLLLATIYNSSSQVDMSRKIVLTTSSGATLNLRFRAAANMTPIKLKNQYDRPVELNVGSSWSEPYTISAGNGNQVTIYGNIDGLDLNGIDVPEYNKVSGIEIHPNSNLRTLICNNNLLNRLDLGNAPFIQEVQCQYNQIASLSVSGCNIIRELICCNNQFSTLAIDTIYCSLPIASPTAIYGIYPLNARTSNNLPEILESNAQIAREKGWVVRYYNGSAPNYVDIQTTGNYQCQGSSPNLNKYITLSLNPQANVYYFKIKATTPNTPIRVVHGNETRDLSIGTDWSFQEYPGGLSEMKIYGDITGLDINGGNNKMTALDLTHNSDLEELLCANAGLSTLDVTNSTKLKKLHCQNNRLTGLNIRNNTQLEEVAFFGNQFTTFTVDTIYCALRQIPAGTTQGKCYPALSETSETTAVIRATNAQNARNKNWQVLYYENTPAPYIQTTGTYACGSPEPSVNMSKYITITLNPQAPDYGVKIKATNANTLVRFVRGNNTENATIGTDWFTKGFPGGDSELKIYGDITGLDINGGNNKMTALDLTHNSDLEDLLCANAGLSTLDVTNSTKLKKLHCQDNRLTGLNIRNNTQLEEVAFFGNQFTTFTVDTIYCALRQIPAGTTQGKCYPALSQTSETTADIRATNAQNARAKNWQVLYYSANSTGANGIQTNGTYACGSPEPSVNMSKYITITLNPQAPDYGVKIKATNASTLVRFVRGNNTENATIGTDWFTKGFPGGDSELKIYGDITGLDINGGNNKMTALDITHNSDLEELLCANAGLSTLDVTNSTKLKKLHCQDNRLTGLNIRNNNQLEEVAFFGNQFTTFTVDTIYCALRQIPAGTTQGKCYPALSQTSETTADIRATNAQNARAKNWQVLYYSANSTGANGIQTNGTYACGSPEPSVNMSKYITITLNPQAPDYGVKIKATNANTLVRFVRGNNTENATIGTDWFTKGFPGGDSELKIYGDITGLDINGGNNKMTALDLTHNSDLEDLLCANAGLSTLDVTNSTKLKKLHCQDNRLTGLNIRNNTQLEEVAFFGNQFTTFTVDTIYCALRQIPAGTTQGKCYPALSQTSETTADIRATNAQNARNKNWQVLYYENTPAPYIQTTGTYACGSPEPSVNMSKYITVTLNPQAPDYRVKIKAANANTLVRFVRGNNTENATIGTDWFTKGFPGGDSELKIYGDITGLDINGGNNKMTALDLTHNSDLEELLCQKTGLSTLDVSNSTKLKKLHCQDNRLTGLNIRNNNQLSELVLYGNQFSKYTIDTIYCALPNASATQSKVIYPLNSIGDTDNEMVLTTNANNATNKGWKVKYYYGGSSDEMNIQTTGTYACGSPEPSVNMSKYITLSLNPQANFYHFEIKAAAPNTLVRVIYGNETRDLYIGTNWSFQKYHGGLSEMKIYGDVIGLNTESLDNYDMITNIDLTHNSDLEELVCPKTGLSTLDVTNSTKLKKLSCNDNQLTSLDVSKNTQLAILRCGRNQLTSLDVSKNTQLTELSFDGNQLTSLDVSKNTQLVYLSCGRNQLTSLDVSKNTQLATLECGWNKLTSLDLSKNTRLSILYCDGNQLTSLDLSKNTQLGFLYCDGNQLTSLDLSKNTRLKILLCYGNKFTTESMNELYCSLPDRQGREEGTIYPLNKKDDANHETIAAATSDNARNKHWEVKYYSNADAIKNDVPSNGNYDCNSGVDESLASSISVFPNPATSKVQIKLSESVNETLILVDLAGRAVLLEDVISGEATIDVSNLTAGTYFIRVGNITKKLTVK